MIGDGRELRSLLAPVVTRVSGASSLTLTRSFEALSKRFRRCQGLTDKPMRRNPWCWVLYGYNLDAIRAAFQPGWTRS